MAFRLLYLIAIRVFGRLVLLGRGQASKDAEIMVCGPKTSSTSCDQAIFVDQATDARLSSDAVLTEIGRLGERFQRRGAAQRAVRPVLVVATRGRTW